MKLAGQPHKNSKGRIPSHFSVILAGLFFIAGTTWVNNAIANAGPRSITTPSEDTIRWKRTKGGMPYKLWPSKTGKKLEIGKIVKVHFTQYLNDSFVFSTRNAIPAYIEVGAQKFSYDIAEVIPTLKTGDSIVATQ